MNLEFGMVSSIWVVGDGISQVTKNVAPPAMTAIISNKMRREIIFMVIQTSVRWFYMRKDQYAGPGKRCKTEPNRFGPKP
ncbi:hypothetical protein SMB34_05405 [Thalassospira permensis NBRC 106175]|uniref:Uncharacterized protein n=1 Tax=Thalassospira permensis NBRC 106175 TaxID=1353532 RepID=A0ABR4TMJ9_9PROT|nr:hypothetical protein SMB34_05405 [Thalassospira permensis NBRC 106175]